MVRPRMKFFYGAAGTGRAARCLTLLIMTAAGSALVLGAGVVGGGAPCLAASCRLRPEVFDALTSDDDVAVHEVYVPQWRDVYYVFEPKALTPATGFIIYPGGTADPRAYAPTAHALAAGGYLTVIVSMPLDLAVLGSRRALHIIRTYRDIETWAVGGHSLGGAMACKYARRYTWSVEAAILWAAYPSALYSLEREPLKVISIYGTNDGLATLEDIEQSREHLPADTVWVEIQGGNHAQFGWVECDDLGDDNPADITLEEQQAAIRDATAAFLGAR